MEVIFLLGGFYCVFRAFGAYNRHDDASWRSFRGDYAVEDGCMGCLWWVVAAVMLLVAVV